MIINVYWSLNITKSSHANPIWKYNISWRIENEAKWHWELGRRPFSLRAIWQRNNRQNILPHAQLRPRSIISACASLTFENIRALPCHITLSPLWRWWYWRHYFMGLGINFWGTFSSVLTPAPGVIDEEYMMEHRICDINRNISITAFPYDVWIDSEISRNSWATTKWPMVALWAINLFYDIRREASMPI